MRPMPLSLSSHFGPIDIVSSCKQHFAFKSKDIKRAITDSSAKRGDLASHQDLGCSIPIKIDISLLEQLLAILSFYVNV